MTDLVLTENRAAAPEKRKIDPWLGALAAISIAWYSLGLMVFLFTLQMGEAAISNLYTDAQIQYLMNTPVWVKMANSVSVLAGLVGSVYLWLQRRSAYYWYMLSLVAYLVMMLDYGLRSGFSIMSPSLLGASLMSIIISVFLFWASYNAQNEGALSAT